MFTLHTHENANPGGLIFGSIIAGSLLFLALLIGCSSPTEPKRDLPEPLTLVSVSPADGATSVGLSTSMTATFSKDLDASTVTSATFSIIGVAGTSSASGKVATFTPKAALSHDKDYTLTITTGLKDKDGLSLAQTSASSFKTLQKPDELTVVSLSPADGAIGVGLNTSVTATFSKDLDASTVTIKTFSIVGVAGTIRASGKVATFTPSAELDHNKDYTLTITTELKDLDGQSLARASRSSFKTAPKPEQLTLVSLNPADGATGVALSTIINATFSKDLDVSTVTSATFSIMGVPGTTSARGKVATFTPLVALFQNKDYTLTITTGLMDLEGQSLAQSSTSSFKTAINLSASAGFDQQVSASTIRDQVTVTLQGLSSGTGAFHTWTQTFGPDVGALVGNRPSFTAPEEVSTLVFEFTVSNGTNPSASDEVVIYVVRDRDRAIWVSPNGNDHPDRKPRGGRSNPMRTIQAAIDTAYARAGWKGIPPDVYVAEGTYSESITLRSNISIYGGFGENDWIRDIPMYTTIIDGGQTAVIGNNANYVTLDGLTIKSESATPFSGSSTAVTFVGSQSVTISNNVIIAGAGAGGRAGSNSSRPSNQPNGAKGQNAGLCEFSGNGGSGGNGTISDGGRGGDGEAFGGDDGANGNGAILQICCPPVYAGLGGNGGGAVGGNGHNGLAGIDGKKAQHADCAATKFGTVSNGEYLAANGNPGYIGSPGRGGGGGGGGGGVAPFLPTCGAGGGGGGAGGIGGPGGEGGKGGGGSFGIILSNSSVAYVQNNDIFTSNGSLGGNGGAGAPGGSGGSGAPGGSGNGGGKGGRGGDGGTGGRGGNGGGGGGGPTIGIITSNGSAAYQSNNSFYLGAPGLGGSAYNSQGCGGSNGERAATKDIP